MPRSTSRRTCCAVVCSASRAVRAAASGRSRCSRACRGAARARAYRVRARAPLARLARSSYFGSNTPLETVESAAEHLEPRLVALSAATIEPIQVSMAQLRELARRYRVALGGAGAADVDADELGVLTLPGDAVAEAERVTISWAPSTIDPRIRSPRSLQHVKDPRPYHRAEAGCRQPEAEVVSGNLNYLERDRMRVLEGKAAIVTGSARGIGRATAELLSAQGAPCSSTTSTATRRADCDGSRARRRSSPAT